MAKIKVEGVDPFKGKLKKLRKVLKENRELYLEPANIVLAKAKAMAPVGPTGNLRRSGRVEPFAGEARILFGGPDVEYVFPVHSGTVRPRPQGGYSLPNPFLYNALEVSEDAVVSAFENTLDTLIVRIGL